MEPFPPFIDAPVDYYMKRAQCPHCGARHCDSCRIFGDRIPEDDAMKTHAWRCYGKKHLRVGGVNVKRRYYRCTRCTSFGIPRQMCKDTYPNDKERWHPLNGSVLAPCNS